MSGMLGLLGWWLGMLVPALWQTLVPVWMPEDVPPANVLVGQVEAVLWEEKERLVRDYDDERAPDLWSSTSRALTLEGRQENGLTWKVRLTRPVRCYGWLRSLEEIRSLKLLGDRVQLHFRNGRLEEIRKHKE